MKKLLQKSCLPVFCLLLAASMAPRAQAGNVNFDCGKGFPTSTSFCVGTIQTNSTDFWTTGSGISNIFNSNGPFTASDTFSLEFNTEFSTISITGAGVTLYGVINSFSVSNARGANVYDIFLDVTWTGLPSNIQGILGTQGGLSPMGLVIGVYRTSTTLQSEFVDISISPTPEPTTMILFGSGLLAGAGLLRRKMHRRQ